MDRHTYHPTALACLYRKITVTVISGNWVIALLVFTLALAVYNATLTPSLSYKSPDGNELATIPYILGLAHTLKT